MGNNTLTTIAGGIGKKEQVNQYKEALVGDILPRNVDGVVEEFAGNIGSDLVPFKQVNATVINKVATRKKKEFLTAGSHTFTVPEGVNEIKVILAGGGGGGSATRGTGSPVMQGGNGAGAGIICLKCGESDNISISVGSGGTGGYTNLSASVAGNAGGNTSLSLNSVVKATAYGGAGGSSAIASIGTGGKFLCDTSLIVSSASGGNGGRYGDIYTSGSGGLTGKGGSGYGGGGGSIGDGGVYANNNGTASGGGGGFSDGANGDVGGGAYAKGGAGGNGGAIIYYDLPSWATDPNNGVDA